MKIVITVDSHLRFRIDKLSKVSKKCLVRIQKHFQKANSTYHSLKRQRYSTKGVPKILKSYKISKTSPKIISLSRGCMKPLRKILKKYGHTIKIIDNRVEYPSVIFSDNISLREEQLKPFESIMKKKQGCVRGPCCLVGGTKININRGGKGYTETIKRIYNKSNGNPEGLKYFRPYDKNIQTQVRSFNGKSIQLNGTEDVIYSGKRLVYELVLENGFSLQATPDHKIMTQNGFKKLSSLKKSDLVMCDTPKAKKSKNVRKPKKRQLEVDALWFHPYASKQKTKKWKRGYTKRTSMHRAIYEAHINGLTLEAYKTIVRWEEDLAKKLKFTNPKTHHIHHINFDHYDNSIDNLECLTVSQHALLHSEHARYNFNQGLPEYHRVKSKKKIGVRDTYDIQCSNPHRNFVANGMVVHNSAGKTIILLKAIAEAQQPALVVVWETAHQKGWLSEIQKFFDISLDEIGGVGGVFSDRKAWKAMYPDEKFPGRRFGLINVCMQQSLCNKDNLDFFVDRVGFVGGDEVQRFAANTFQNVINEFPAKYRIGVSANEKRKDGKHFLVHDTFGPVIHQIEDKDVGSRRPSKVFKIPTKFHSDTYADDKSQHVQLLNEMAEDHDRNKLILKHVKRSIKKNKLCLVLVERKIQALALKYALQGYGVGLIFGHTTNKEIQLASWLPKWKDFMYRFDHDKEFNRVKRVGEKRKLDVIIGTQKAFVGINIRTIDHVFACTPTAKNMELLNQQKGRGERDHDEAMEKKFGVKATPHFYYFWDVMHEALQKAGNRLDRSYPDTSVLKLFK